MIAAELTGTKGQSQHLVDWTNPKVGDGEVGAKSQESNLMPSC